tara:strand:- start:838 stop:1842 length:1005 start_codon:yes stop_codon:yes gene_type:complete
MKLTKLQLKQLVEEVILEENTKDIVSEEQVQQLEEGFADIMQKMRSSGRSAIRGFLRKSANSKANRKIEAALDNAEELPPEQKKEALDSAWMASGYMIEQLVDIFDEFEVKFRSINDKLQAKLKQSAISPQTLQRMAEMLSLEDEEAPEGDVVRTVDDRDADFGTVKTGPPENMPTGNRLEEAEATSVVADSLFRASAELVNWIVTMEGFSAQLSDIAGTAGTGGALRDVLEKYADLGGAGMSPAMRFSGSNPKKKKSDVAMSVTDDPNQPTKVAPGPRVGTASAKAGATPASAVRTLQPGKTADLGRTRRRNESVELSKEYLEKLVNELKDKK